MKHIEPRKGDRKFDKTFQEHEVIHLCSGARETGFTIACKYYLLLFKNFRNHISIKKSEFIFICHASLYDCLKDPKSWSSQGLNSQPRTWYSNTQPTELTENPPFFDIACRVLCTVWHYYNHIRNEVQWQVAYFVVYCFSSVLLVLVVSSLPSSSLSLYLSI